MEQLITNIDNMWSSVSTQVKLLASAISGIVLIFYIFKAFVGDEQDTKAAVKNIKRVIVLWVIIMVAPSLLAA